MIKKNCSNHASLRVAQPYQWSLQSTRLQLQNPSTQVAVLVHTTYRQLVASPNPQPTTQLPNKSV